MLLQFVLNPVCYAIVAILLHRCIRNQKIVSSSLSLFNACLIVPLTFRLHGLDYYDDGGYDYTDMDSYNATQCLVSPMFYMDYSKTLYDQLTWIASCTFGYLLVDLYLLCRKNQPFSVKERNSYLLHHFVGFLMIYIIVMIAKPCLYLLAIDTLLTELSSVVANVFSILYVATPTYKRLLLIIGLFMTILHFYTRLFHVPYSFYSSYSCISTYLVHQQIFIYTTYLLFTGLNVYWGYRMMKGIIKHVKPKQNVIGVVPNKS